MRKKSVGDKLSPVEEVSSILEHTTKQLTTKTGVITPKTEVFINK